MEHTTFKTFSSLNNHIERQTKILNLAQKLQNICYANEPNCILVASKIDNTIYNVYSYYSMGEEYIFQFKGETFLSVDHTKCYSGRGTKYNDKITYGKIVFDFRTKKALKAFIDDYAEYISSKKCGGFKFVKYVTLKKSKIKERFEIDRILRYQKYKK